MDCLYVAKARLDASGVKANLQTFEELAVQQRDLTIDMSAVDLLDGSGMGALVFVYKRLRSAGHQVRLMNVRGQPLSMLQKLGLSQILLANDDSAFYVAP